MRSWEAVRLIAGREIAVRVRSKAYLLTTAALAAGMVLFSFVLALTAGDDSPVEVGVADASLADVLEQAGHQVGTEVDAQVMAREEGRADVLAGELQAWVSSDPGGGLQALVDRELDRELATVLGAAARSLELERRVTALGGDPADFAAGLAAADVRVEPLGEPRNYEPQQLFLGAVAGVLIFVALQFGGQMVAQGVVEEKTSRVVELLLATVRPLELMTGKVLGIGVVALAQVTLVAVAGVGSALALDTLTIPAGTTASAVVWLLVWFVLGFTIYALLSAGFAALVPRQEDVNAVVMPVMLLMMVGYVMGISLLPSDPDHTVAGWMSLVPFFAPTMMPIRLAIGSVPAWQVVLSLGLAVAVVPLLLWLAGRMYRNAVMHTGVRVRLRDALLRA